MAPTVVTAAVVAAIVLTAAVDAAAVVTAAVVAAAVVLAIAVRNPAGLGTLGWVASGVFFKMTRNQSPDAKLQGFGLGLGDCGSYTTGCDSMFVVLAVSLHGCIVHRRHSNLNAHETLLD